ncbi:MAG: elongation factor Ts [Candidatus Omnitrophica bacterium]|nr:elongation factor Ts [Candidatus Omnitrophota bacterium]
MKKISLDLIKELRNMTLASVANCKAALEDADGDLMKAAGLIRKRGLEIAAKKGDRVAKEGRIEAYVHLGNKVGVLLEVDSETDFVARNPEFCQFTKDVAMQITALNPGYLKREDVPQNVLEQEKDKELFYKTHCLLEQAFVKDPSITIKDYLGSLVAKLNENIVIRRFIRYKIGE